MKKVIIIGAGPAGITAGYELLKQSNEYEVTILEESSCVGGISRTEVHNGHRMDIGGHRFFSKSQEVNDWWEQIMPMQGAPAYDDDKLNRDVPLVQGGPNPEKADRVMLNRSRISHIYYKRKFFEYPVRMNMDTIKNMGFGTTMQAGFSYLGSMVAKKPVNSLENFYINQFGRKLYSMFFEGYTEKLWGRHPREIDPSWGAQRTKGLSITEIVKDATRKVFHKEAKEVNTSLIGAFKYPKLGPGQLWECAAADFEAMGGSIHYNCRVIRINTNGNQVESVTCAVDGITIEEKADIVISSMPIKDLIIGMNNVPGNVSEVARKLPYRDFVTVGLLIPKLRISNTTYMRTLGNVIPDTWIYVQDPGIKMGRIQIFNNWSPYLVENPEKTVWVGLEYFCNEGDRYWNMTDEEWIDFATKELIQMGILSESAKVLDSHKVAVKKAYPAYFDTYSRFDEVRTYLDGFENLYCVGRNGQHRYNNMDHSMITAFETVKNIINGVKDKSNIWNVNTEQEYHEEKEVKEEPKAEEKAKTTTAPVPPVKEAPKAAEGAVVAASVAASVPASQPVKEEELQATVQAVPAPPVRKQLRRNPIPKVPVEETNNQGVSPVSAVAETPVIMAEIPVAQESVSVPAPEVAVVSQEAEIHVSRSRSIWDDVEYAEATAAVKTAPIRFKSVEEAHAAVKGNSAENKAETKKKEKTENVVVEEKEEPVVVEEKAAKVEEKTPDKKRNTRKKATATKAEKAVEAIVAAEVAETVKEEKTEKEVAIDATDNIESAETKKPSRTRRKKNVEESATIENTETNSVEKTVVEEQSTAELPAEAQTVETKKPSRSRRKNPVSAEENVETQKESIQVEKTGVETAEETATEEQPAEVKKPSRSRRKKPVEVKADVVEEVKVESVEEAVEEVKAEIVEEAVEEVKAEVVEEAVEEVKAETVEEAVEEVKAEVEEEAVEEVKAEVVEEAVEEVKAEVVEEAVEEVKTESVEADFRRSSRSTSGKTIAGRTASRRVSSDRHSSNRRKVEEPAKKVSNVGKEAVVGNMKGTVIKSNVIQKTPDNQSSDKRNKR